MSTPVSNGRQFTVCTKEQILQECEKAHYIDCRLNAYPAVSENAIIAPTIIFIDIDGNSKLELDKLLKRTLNMTKLKLNDCVPTVLWTGNGYHMYLIIDIIALELMPKFNELFEEPSKLFLKFAESCLTNKRNDPKHHPTFKSCLLRIPGTLNSKSFVQGADPEVKIIQRFQDTARLGTSLLPDFRLYLADRQIDTKRNLVKKNLYNFQNQQQIQWIEKLLITPITDYRKYTIDLILAPYLIVVKNYSEEDAFNKILIWADKCNELKNLSPSIYYFENRIRTAIENSSHKKIPPISVHNLKLKYSAWFGALNNMLYPR
jgi:Primase X